MATEAAARPRSARYEQLDALRGVAALSVGLSHHLTVVEGVSPTSPYHEAAHVAHLLRFAPSYAFMAGHESVLLFFVLSGFVLTLPWLRRAQDPYPVFMLRRLARLYVPYTAAVAVALLLTVALAGLPAPPLGPWLANHWAKPVDAGVVGDYALMVHHFDVDQFDPVLWSLVVEMRMSILFPLIAWAATRIPVRASLAISFLCALLPVVAERAFPGPVATDFLDSCHFFGVFVFGSLAARVFPALLTRFHALGSAQRGVLFLLAWLAYNYGRAAHHVFPFAGDYFIAPAAVVFFLFAVASDPGRRFFRHATIRFLGRISFSYYLIHAIVLFATFRLLYFRAGLAVTWSVSLAAGVGVAALFYSLVERPTLSLSRVIGDRFRSARRRVARAAA